MKDIKLGTDRAGGVNKGTVLKKGLREWSEEEKENDTVKGKTLRQRGKGAMD